MIFFILWTFFCGNLVINSLTNCNYSVLIFYQNSRKFSLTTCFFNKSYLQHCQCKMTLSFDPVVEIHHLAALDGWRFVLLRHTGCRRGHTPFTNVEAVKPDPLFLEGFSRRAGVDVGDESTESHSVVQPLCILLIICPECRISVVVRWTDELCGGWGWMPWFETPCIHTQRTVSTTWSRCFMARCPKDSVALLRQSSASWMPV